MHSGRIFSSPFRTSRAAMRPFPTAPRPARGVPQQVVSVRKPISSHSTRTQAHRLVPTSGGLSTNSTSIDLKPFSEPWPSRRVAPQSPSLSCAVGPTAGARRSSTSAPSVVAPRPRTSPALPADTTAAVRFSTSSFRLCRPSRRLAAPSPLRRQHAAAYLPKAELYLFVSNSTLTHPEHHGNGCHATAGGRSRAARIPPTR